MKKADKIQLLHDSIGTYNLCECLFTYDVSDRYLYILDYSDNFLFGIEECDFLLDGFQIRKISDLKKIETYSGLASKINEENNLLADVKKQKVDLSSWKTVFESLVVLNIFLIVENARTDNDEDFFHLGYVREIKDSYIIFSSVDADGVWYDNIKIPYSKITNVAFNDRYSKTWQKYLSK